MDSSVSLKDQIWFLRVCHHVSNVLYYRGADKSLARPGKKQARKHVRDARDFNKIETRAVIKFLSLRGKAPKEIYAILTETLACFLPGRAKDLSAHLYSINKRITVFINCFGVVFRRCISALPGNGLKEGFSIQMSPLKTTHSCVSFCSQGMGWAERRYIILCFGLISIADCVMKALSDWHDWST